jgi:putative sterol carrier protein
MPEATTEFFERLGRGVHEPLLEKAHGRIRFELANGKQVERWLVVLDKGDVDVSHKKGQADCTLHTSQALFDEIVLGRENAMAAVLRGAIELDGDPELVLLFQRLFPSPAKSNGGKR